MNGVLNTDDLEGLSPASLVAALAAEYVEEILLGENLFVGSLPEAPASCLAAYDMGGPPQNDRLALDESRVKIVGRGKYDATYNWLQSIQRALQSFPPSDLPDKKLVGIWVNTMPTHIGRDSDDLSLFTSEFRIVTELKDGVHRMPYSPLNPYKTNFVWDFTEDDPIFNFTEETPVLNFI